MYVDDLLVTGTTVAAINNFKEQMKREFDMSDLGKLSHYLGIEINQTKDFNELKQTSYAKKVLEKSGMAECNSSKYPMEPGLKLGKDELGAPVDPTKFKSVVGLSRYYIIPHDS